MDTIDKILVCIGFYAVCSIIAILLYGHDKRAAINNERRISENSLHFIGVLGGWPGAFYAMRHYRHKTRKLSFRITFWVTVILNLFIVLFIFTKTGRELLMGVLHVQ